MILQATLVFTAFDILIISCWLAVIITFAVSAILFIQKTKDKSKKVKYYLLGIALFCLLYCVNRIVMFTYELTFPNFVWSYNLTELNAVYDAYPELSDKYLLYWRIATAAGSLGLLFLLIGLELFILEGKTKYIFSIFQAVTGTLSIIFGVSEGEAMSIGRALLYIGILPSLAVPFIYFYYAAKSKGLVRRRALGAGFGFFIFYLGIAANSTLGKQVISVLYRVGVNGIFISYIVYGIFVPIGLLIFWKTIKF